MAERVEMEITTEASTQRGNSLPQASPVVPTPIISSGPSTTRPIQTTSVTTGQFKREITPEELVNLLQGQNKCTLLIDCRNSEKYQSGKIKFPQCINIPIEIGSTVSGGFTSKAEAVKFIQAHCSKLLGHLNLPGFYDDIVLYNEDSTFERLPKSIKIVLEATQKWNEATKTRTLVLQGGMQAWSKAYPTLLLTEGSNITVSACRNIQPMVQQQELPDPMHMSPVSTDSNDIINNLKKHLSNLDLAVGTTIALINIKGYLKSFESVKLVLLQEHERQLIKDLDKLIPTEVKCPVCLEVYEGEVLQCVNGHCICTTCCKQLKDCPECRLVYGAVKIRNRVLEHLLLSTLRVNCPACGEILLYTQSQHHVKVCVSRKIAEIMEIETQIRWAETEIEKFAKKREQVNKYVLDTEHNWISAEGKQNQFITDNAGEKILEEVFARKVTMSTLNVALLSTVFLKSECKFKIFSKLELNRA